MIEQTGATYTSSEYFKMLIAANAKDGKTSFLVGSILGALPWQKNGGLVTKPEHLHIITFDANAFGGVKDFITKSCGKPPSYTEAIKVYNMQEDVAKLYANDVDWDLSLFNTLMNVYDIIQQRVAKGGTHAIVISSVTGLAKAIQRGIAGPPSERKKGSGMDASKWQSLDGQLSEIQNTFQRDTAHVFWEAHVDKTPEFGQGKDGNDGPKETIQIAGKAGRWWAFNTEQALRLRREPLNRMGAVDKVYMDTRPSADFLSGGRNFTERLEPKEYCLVSMASKLGLKVGGFRGDAGQAVNPVQGGTKGGQR